MINVQFDADPIWRERKAVFEFCASIRAPVVNLRNLLISGDQTNPRNDLPIDVTCGFSSEAEGPERYMEMQEKSILNLL